VSQRRGGLDALHIDGILQDARGNFTYGLGKPMRESIVGAERVHGYSQKPTVAFIEGEITDRGDLDLAAMQAVDGIPVTLTLGNGKVVILSQAWFAGEGVGNTEEGNIAVRFEGKFAEEVS
jgi:hypothetical protein